MKNECWCCNPCDDRNTKLKAAFRHRVTFSSGYRMLPLSERVSICWAGSRTNKKLLVERWTLPVKAIKWGWKIETKHGSIKEKHMKVIFIFNCANSTQCDNRQRRMFFMGILPMPAQFVQQHFVPALRLHGFMLQQGHRRDQPSRRWTMR